ncbi:VOC family protein [[Kitasatospora] papulosa]|uniref:VOC family protein n=1 Tax=[Kitasatospora] papulosa TaxID=1464011 RepID=UPI0038032C06
MPITLASVIIDAADIEKESSFWHRLLGGSLTPTPTHRFVQAPGLPVVVVQSAPGHTAPNWPHGTSQQMHLDFGVDDLATADRTATDAGATRLPPTDQIPPETRTGNRIYASPAGHPFCLRLA